MKSRYLSQIVLLRPSLENWREIASNPEKGCESLGLMCGEVEDVLASAAKLTSKFIEDLSLAQSQWACFLAIDKGTSQIVGTCGYKGPPGKDGRVEVAYFTFPQFEGLGCATMMTKELMRHALNSSAVTMVIAHTLPSENASTRVLRKCGFSLSGEVQDPEDGKVWLWEKQSRSLGADQQ